MLIKIGKFDITECWDGVFYKKLSGYPDITEWELQNVADFMRYEEENGRSCAVEAEESIRKAVEEYKRTSGGRRVAPPEIIKECTACPKYGGCMTDLVCHTSPLENAIKILDCGRLLSPVIARGVPAKELRREKRNAANDPEDYFEYIMFAWGNCQAGDRLVMERKLHRFPTEEDLSIHFTPGVRFFFRYNDLIRHPGAVFDGVLPLKIKDEVVLSEWVSAIIAPDIYRETAEPHVPKELRAKVFFLDGGGKDIWQWSETAYEFARNIK